MTISELIAKLTELQAEHGDIPVGIVDMDTYSGLSCPPEQPEVKNADLANAHSMKISEGEKFVTILPS